MDSLPGKEAQKVTWVLQLVEELEIVPALYFKKLADMDELWECRVKLGSNIYRLLAFFMGREVVLTHGFAKKTQKTPAGEIDRARRYRTEYLLRMGKKP